MDDAGGNQKADIVVKSLDGLDLPPLVRDTVRAQVLLQLRVASEEAVALLLDDVAWMMDETVVLSTDVEVNRGCREPKGPGSIVPHGRGGKRRLSRAERSRLESLAAELRDAALGAYIRTVEVDGQRHEGKVGPGGDGWPRNWGLPAWLRILTALLERGWRPPAVEREVAAVGSIEDVEARQEATEKGEPVEPVEEPPAVEEAVEPVVPAPAPVPAPVPAVQAAEPEPAPRKRDRKPKAEKTSVPAPAEETPAELQPRGLFD